MSSSRAKGLRYHPIICLRRFKRVNRNLRRDSKWLYPKYKGGGTPIPVQAWTGPEVSRSFRLPDLKTNGTWRWSVCQPYAPAAFTLQKILLVVVSVRDWVDSRAIVRPEGSYQQKYSNDTIGNRAGGLPACRALPTECKPEYFPI